MNIAVLGWGSLIWCPGNLRIRTRWRTDGPLLPIEFARISLDGRLTLVIHPGSVAQPTYWALSELTTLEEARNNVRERENSGLDDIHCHSQGGTWGSKTAPAEIANRMGEWMAHHERIHAVVWTGLACNWGEKRGRDFSPDDAVAYLLELEAERNRPKAPHNRAREYVTNAPPAIDTEVRRAMRARGWEDAPLAPILFEAPSRGA